MSKPNATYEKMKKQLRDWKKQIDELDRFETRLKDAATQTTATYHSEVDALRAQMEAQVQTWRSEVSTVKAKTGSANAQAKTKLEMLIVQIEAQLDQWRAGSATLSNPATRWTRSEAEEYIDTLRTQHRTARKKLRVLKEPGKVRPKTAEAESRRALNELKQSVKKAMKSQVIESKR